MGLRGKQFVNNNTVIAALRKWVTSAGAAGAQHDGSASSLLKMHSQ
jgi:hypothetical protein